MKARPDVVELSHRLADEADRWRAAYRAWLRACARRDEQLERAERRVVAATGGLGLVRWEAAVRRRRFRTIEDAKLKARAIRAKPTVEAALAEKVEIVRGCDSAVFASAARLAELSERICVFGNLAATVTGVPLPELHRLAHLSAVPVDSRRRRAPTLREVPTPPRR